MLEVASSELENSCIDVARILVVDDNSISRKKMRMAVESLGHKADAARDGAEALKLLASQPYDAVLLDIVMPEIDGFDVLETLKDAEQLRDIPVIVISALDDETESVVRAIELGAVDFLPKDFEPGILKARLDSSLAQKRFRDRERRYFQDVEQLTRAAEVIEAPAFRLSELDIDNVAKRTDPLGRLAGVFGGLAQEIYEREKKMDRTARTLRGMLLVLVAGGIFGIKPALGRMAGGFDVSILGIVVWANIVAAILCLMVAGLRGKLPRLKLSHIPFFVAWALIQGCLYQLFTVLIAQHIEATTISLIGSTRGFMVFALAALIALEPPNMRRFVGLGIGFTAITAVLFMRSTDSSGLDIQWLIAAFGLPVLLAAHTLLMAWRPREIDAFATVGIMMVLSTAMLAPVAYTMGSVYWPSDGLGQIEIIILVFGIASGVALALALDLVATAGAVFASQMAYSQTLAGIAWGMILLGEQLSMLAWGAFGLVILGVWLVEPKQAGEEFSVTLALKRR